MNRKFRRPAASKKSMTMNKIELIESCGKGLNEKVHSGLT